MRNLWFGIISLLLLSGFWTAIPTLSGQSPNDVAVHLVQADKTTISASSVLGAGCDVTGNLFIQKMPDFETAGDSVLELDRNGQIKTTFELPANLIPHTLFVSEDGTLYRVATSSDRRNAYLLKYDRNGNLHSRTTLKLPSVPGLWVPPFNASQLAVFENGNFLISGSQWTADREVPFTAVFRRDGSIEKRLSPDGDADYWPDSDIGRTDAAIALGDIVVATDGNAYLLRRTRPAKIHVISEAGKIVKQLTFEVGGSRLFPLEMVSGDGRIAILFEDAVEVEMPLLGVFDLSGNALVTIAVPRDFGSLVCYEPPQFTTLKQVEQRRYELMRWRPR